MEIEQRSIGKVTVLGLSGRIEGRADSGDFAAALMGASSPVALNLGRVESIDGDGIGMIISGCTSFIQRNGWVALAELSDRMDPMARNVLGRTLKAFDREDEAIAFLEQT